jgi:hypothetical protein
MGGKGGGGGNYYEQPPDTSGYATPEEAKKTLAKETPLDLSQYQQTVNVKKKAAEATAKPPPPAVLAEGVSNTATTEDEDTGTVLAKSIVKPPEYWAALGKTPSPIKHRDPTLTSIQI